MQQALRVKINENRKLKQNKSFKLSDFSFFSDNKNLI